MYKERIFTCPRCNNIVRTGDKYGCDYTRYCRKCKAKFKVFGQCGVCNKKKNLAGAIVVEVMNVMIAIILVQ